MFFFVYPNFHASNCVIDIYLFKQIYLGLYLFYYSFSNINKTMQQQAEKIVFDIGAHEGLDTAYYLQMGCKVVAVEANPSLCSYLRDKFSFEIQHKKFILIEAAIGDVSNHEVSFFLGEDAGESSLSDERLKKLGLKYECITVRTKTLGDIFCEFGKGLYCKMDIEGADVTALRSLQPGQNLPEYFSVELSGLPIEELIHQPSELFATATELERLGYTRFKLVDQYTLATLSDKEFYPKQGKILFRLVKKFQRILNMPLQKINPRNWYSRNLDYPFTLNTSGPFGDDVAGNWNSVEAIRRIIKERFYEYCKIEKNKHNIFWVDLHATY
jgi:FkbM family methyltransferase